MANATTMTYGGYSFTPVPLVQFGRGHEQRGNRDLPIGYKFTMTLSGTLTPLPDGVTGLIQTDSLIDELRTAFNRSGKLLEIKCGATTVMQIYPDVVRVSFDESNNNWVQTVPFTIELEYCNDDLGEHPEAPPYIEDFTEEWSMEFIQDQRMFMWNLSTLANQASGKDYAAIDGNNPFEVKVTHTVSVKGKQTWAGTGEQTGTMTKAADNALNWINTEYAGFSYNPYLYGHALSGWTDLVGGSGYSEFDHMRSHVVNETEGTVNLTESWVILGDNSGLGAVARKMTEDFTVSVRRNNSDGRVSVLVDGQIKGYEERDYTILEALTPVTTSAYDNAAAAWAVIKDRVFPRSQFIFQQDFSTLLNPEPSNITVGHQGSKGIITYSYEFDDRPCSFITGSLSEQFTITDNNPSDVFASISVLGRVQGPVLQEITTVTVATREVTIEAVMPQPTGCSVIADLDLNKPTENVENLLCQFETQLSSSYDQVFKHTDTASWSPLAGRYSRTVGWTYQSCSGEVNTSFC